MTFSKYLLITLLVFPVLVSAQNAKATLSGMVKDAASKSPLSFVTVMFKSAKDSSLISGSISNEQGRFSATDLSSGTYILELSLVGYRRMVQNIEVGKLSSFLDLGIIELQAEAIQLGEVVVSGQQDEVSSRMDKKTFSLADNLSLSGGSVLQAMQNLPGITTDNDGKVLLRGSDKVMVLIDGKQTALTGFGNQKGLDNIPASAIEKIEIINNPSSKYDANGNAGIINIIYKKSKEEGWNGKIGVMAGLGALWPKAESLPDVRPQYQATPKFNPSLALNYRHNKINAFLQSDWLLDKTLNRNEFTTRTYEDGNIIRQQVQRNRTTTNIAAKAGLDYNITANDALTIAGLYSNEHVLDDGDIPYFNEDLSTRRRLWLFHEDEYNTAFTASAVYQHKFKQAGHTLNMSFNYTFHREDEKYFLTNRMPTFTGRDTFMLIADESVSDLNVDYVKPLKYGRFESGLKLRRRYIPTNMRFMPGLNSPLDTNAAGWANYGETIPALYGNYVYERHRFELEAGLRMEYVRLNYTVNPDHNTYKSDGYNYIQPFPSVRLSYNLKNNSKLSLFYNRRVDRPDEGDIRIFPKYDEPEILKVGNPALRPQFTNTFELGYRSSWPKGYWYSALYHRMVDGTKVRIGTIVPGSTIIYNIYQNARNSYNTGLEGVVQQSVNKWFSFSANLNIYRNTIDAFTVENKYPVPSTFSSSKETYTSGSVKLNAAFQLPKRTEIQISSIYLAPDIIPQGEIGARFSVNIGIKKTIQKGKGELFLNGSDVLNTLQIHKKISGTGFSYVTTDYYETQAFRVGYSWKF